MPEANPKSTYDSTIIPSDGRKITLQDEQAHEDALQQEIPLAKLVAALKELEPSKADVLDAKLQKCNEGKLAIPGAYQLIKMTVGLPNIQTAFEKIVPGFDKRFCMPGGHQHPIVV